MKIPMLQPSPRTTDRPRTPLLVKAAFAAAIEFGIVNAVWPAPTPIANEPLAQAASSVKPNIMFILDDSGSMDWDYTPDYVNDSGSGASCFDNGDDNSANGLITDGPNPCVLGDPPYMSPDFNTQYYNPEIYYRPGTNFDGTDRPSQNSANTSGWTAVKINQYVSNTNTNLVTGYPDRVWCSSRAASATDTALCKTNTSYAYPSLSFPFGTTTGGSVKYKNGGPYYYRIQATEYCRDVELTDCIDATSATDQYTYPAPVRHCTSTAYTDCQRKRIGSYTIPKYLGSIGGTVQQQGVGSVVVGNSGSDVSVNIASLSINGVALINPSYSSGATFGQNVTASGGVITAGTGTNSNNERNAAARMICQAVNNYSATSGYSARTSNLATAGAGAQTQDCSATPGTTGRVFIFTNADTSDSNGFSPVATSDSTGITAAKGMIRVNSTAVGFAISSILVGPPGAEVNIIGSSVSCSAANSATARTNCATAIRNAIGTSFGAVFVSSPIDYIASSSSNDVTITAPTSEGSGVNNYNIVVSVSGSGSITHTGSCSSFKMCGGVTSGSMPLTLNAIANGSTTTTTARINVGSFSRTDIIPSVTSYPKAIGRIDCAGVSSCTYAEEMTNFANWYAYYRTRMQMMKSAAGRAFLPIDDTFRVGFITINTDAPVSSSKYLKINDFTPGATGHKKAWYDKFYAATPSGGTPLREALSRVGRLYGGKFDGINNGIPSADDPIQVSCQPNFAILSTDGYWTTVTSPQTGTTNQGHKLNMSVMDDQDGVSDSGYSKRSDGVFDANGQANTLADVALYYYQTDLRPAGSTNTAGVDVSADNVPQTQNDTASHQHMVTFTLGLGLDGALSYRSDYYDPSVTSGDFYRIKTGAQTCTALGGGSGSSLCKWPSVTPDSPTALDDLWHAAVNGRGIFFSAKNPGELAQSLADTLAQMRTRVGAGAAAATSNLQPVAGDNFAFTAQYQTVTWTGDLKARTIDLSTGIVSSVELWSAANLLDNKNWQDRVIYTLDPTDTTGNKLKHLCWPGDTAATCTDGSGLTAAEQAFFAVNQLVQYGAWNALQKAAATPQMLLSYFKGETVNENSGGGGISDLFRQRASVLGDIVNAQPAYVRASPFSYTDTGYADFKKCTEGTGTGCPAAQFPNPSVRRKPTVFVAANDGFLHAFEVDVNNSPYYQTAGISTPTTADDTFSTGNNAGNGDERWAYVPQMLLSKAYKLANDPYGHDYYTDGSPTVGDVCLSTPCAGVNDWRTVIVAGLNAGGRGFYALDVTNPDAPKALWELRGGTGQTCLTDVQANSGTFFADCNIGLSFGNPIITKRKSDGRWVALLTSGINNFNPGDGRGYLYVVDMATGAILQRLGTGVGSGGTAGAGFADANPSGLARINAWTDNGLYDNTSLAVYGGDLLGNVWRFNLDSSSAGYLSVTRIATLISAGGVAQPVTAKPELGEAFGYRVIMVGTGKFLGTPDKTDTSAQTIYALRDDGLSTTAIAVRGDLQERILQNATSDTRTISNAGTAGAAMDWDAKKGWFIDLPDSGERVTIDPILQLGTLVVSSNVPNNDTCSAGGYAWLNYIDFKTGKVVTTSSGSVVSTRIGASLIVGLNVVQLPGGKVVTIITTADNQQLTRDTPVPSATFSGNRVSWRELVNDR